MTDEELELLKKLEEDPGYISYNHHHVESVEKGKKAVLTIELREESLNPYGFAHGGLIFGLGDTAMGILSRSSGRKAVTLNSTINYLRPVVGKILRAEAEMIKDGKKTCLLRCNFYDENNKLTATMDGNYCYID